jgi:hypothetical protein
LTVANEFPGEAKRLAFFSKKIKSTILAFFDLLCFIAIRAIP